MDKAEQKQIAEINRMKAACAKTTSRYLQKDYRKAIKRMENELKEYRSYKRSD